MVAEPRQRFRISRHKTNGGMTSKLGPAVREAEGRGCGSLDRFTISYRLSRSDQGNVPPEEIGVELERTTSAHRRLQQGQRLSRAWLTPTIEQHLGQ